MQQFSKNLRKFYSNTNTTNPQKMSIQEFNFQGSQNLGGYIVSQPYHYVNPTPTVLPYQGIPYPTTNTPMTYHPQDMYSTGQVYMPTAYPVKTNVHEVILKTGPVTTTPQLQYPTQMQYPTVYGYGYQPGTYNPGNYNPYA